MTKAYTMHGKGRFLSTLAITRNNFHLWLERYYRIIDASPLVDHFGGGWQIRPDCQMKCVVLDVNIYGHSFLTSRD